MIEGKLVAFPAWAAGDDRVRSVLPGQPVVNGGEIWIDDRDSGEPDSSVDVGFGEMEQPVTLAQIDQPGFPGL